MSNYIHEIKVNLRQLRYKDIRLTATVSLVILIGMPIIGILTVANLLTTYIH